MKTKPEKIDVTIIQVGEKVHYVNHCIENGIVKEVIDHEYIRVVFSCDGDWENYINYTGAMTPVRDLYCGWK